MSRGGKLVESHRERMLENAGVASVTLHSGPLRLVAEPFSRCTEEQHAVVSERSRLSRHVGAELLLNEEGILSAHALRVHTNAESSHDTDF